MRTFSELIILFGIISVFGWLMEVTLKYIQYHRFINRGFLIGPYCPIYGYGVVFITVIVGYLSRFTNNAFITFIIGLILCGSIEYLTSWYMEKRFHARWWDYSNKPLNINGRVWIGNLVLFGVASVLIVNFVDPFYFKIISKLNNVALYIIAAFIVVIFLSDYLISHFIMNIVKLSIDTAQGDNTEEVGNEVRNMLKDKNLFISRITKAYPKFKARPKRILIEIKKAKDFYNLKKKEFKELQKELVDKKQEAINNALMKAKENKIIAQKKYLEIKEKMKKLYK